MAAHRRHHRGYFDKDKYDQRIDRADCPGTTPAAQYTAKYAEPGYLWDELAAVAWLDPSIITKTHKVYLDVSIDHGASYGDTLVWNENTRPHLGEREVEIQDDLDKNNFYSEFIELLTRPTPAAKEAK